MELNEPLTETEYGMAKNGVAIEESLRGFWERARAASNLIKQLRQEKGTILQRLDALENEVRSLRTELATRDQELKRMRTEHAQFVNSNGNEFFSIEERENLKNKVRDLIAKINSHL